MKRRIKIEKRPNYYVAFEQKRLFGIWVKTQTLATGETQTEAVEQLKKEDLIKKEANNYKMYEEF